MITCQECGEQYWAITDEYICPHCGVPNPPEEEDAEEEEEG